MAARSAGSNSSLSSNSLGSRLALSLSDITATLTHQPSEPEGAETIMSEEDQSCGNCRGTVTKQREPVWAAGRVRGEEWREPARSVAMGPEVRLAARFAVRPALREAEQALVERY